MQLKKIIILMLSITFNPLTAMGSFHKYQKAFSRCQNLANQLQSKKEINDRFKKRFEEDKTSKQGLECIMQQKYIDEIKKYFKGYYREVINFNIDEYQARIIETKDNPEWSEYEKNKYRTALDFWQNAKQKLESGIDIEETEFFKSLNKK